MLCGGGPSPFPFLAVPSTARSPWGLRALLPGGCSLAMYVLALFPNQALSIINCIDSCLQLEEFMGTGVPVPPLALGCEKQT